MMLSFCADRNAEMLFCAVFGLVFFGCPVVLWVDTKPVQKMTDYSGELASDRVLGEGVFLCRLRVSSGVCFGASEIEITTDICGFCGVFFCCLCG